MALPHACPLYLYRAIQLLRDEPELVLQSSTPQNVALIVGAFARLDVRDEYLLRVVAVYTCESGLVDRCVHVWLQG